MSVTPMHPRRESGNRPAQKVGRVYAIAFDIDTQVAQSVLGDTWKTCYGSIERGLALHGFSRTQGSLFFGDETSNAVKCIKAVQDLDDKHAWFGRIVKDLRMLRIDEDNDLLPALSNRLRLGNPEAA
jgi:virulence-associated protein VapD